MRPVPFFYLVYTVDLHIQGCKYNHWVECNSHILHWEGESQIIIMLLRTLLNILPLWFVCLFCLSVCLGLLVCLFICLSFCLSACVYIRVYLCQSICMSVCLSIHLSLCLSLPDCLSKNEPRSIDYYQLTAAWCNSTL